MRVKGLVKLLILVFGFWFLASGLMGCTVRHYVVTKERVDQDLTGGNRGYLSGTAPAADTSGRKMTRKTHTVEIELSSPVKVKQMPAVNETGKQSPAAVSGISQESYYGEADIDAEPQTKTEETFQEYTVGKNDTLQKISQRFYGTTRKWTKVYDANKDVLKSPDRVYPGQKLRIPQE